MRGDFSLVRPPAEVFSMKWLLAAGAQGTSGGGGFRGEPFVSLLATAAQTGIVKVAADADGTIGTSASGDGRFVGIAKSDSTQTASVAGVVYTWAPLPGLVYRGRPKTAGSCNTAAKIDALRGSAVIFDLTATTNGTYSIDTAATDAAVNAIVLVDGDPNSDTIFWMVKPTWSFIGNVSTLT